MLLLSSHNIFTPYLANASELVLVMWLYMCIVPAGVSLAAVSVDTLGQRVMQTGINHIETDRLLMDLAARVPEQHKHTSINMKGERSAANQSNPSKSKHDSKTDCDAVWTQSHVFSGPMRAEQL